MILLHACQRAEVESHVIDWLSHWLFFFMAWFYFKSGWFFDPARATPYGAWIRRTARRLMIPFASWWMIGLGVQVALFPSPDHPPFWKELGRAIFAFAREGIIVGNMPLWFLVSFLLVQSVAGILVARSSWIGVLFVATGWSLDACSIALPLGLQTVPLGAFFFFAGRLASRHMADRRGWWALLAATFVLANLFVSANVDFRINHANEGSYLAYVLLALLGIAAIRLIASPLGWTPFRWIGNHSMLFFTAHWPVMTLILWRMDRNKGTIGTADQWVLLFTSTLIACSFLVMCRQWIPRGLESLRVATGRD